MRKIRTPFFMVNPKSYLYGERLLKLAKAADEFAKDKDFDVFFTAPFVDLRMIAKKYFQSDRNGAAYGQSESRTRHGLYRAGSTG